MLKPVKCACMENLGVFYELAHGKSWRQKIAAADGDVYVMLTVHVYVVN